MSLLERYRNPHPSSLTLVKLDHEACRISPIRKIFNSTNVPGKNQIRTASVDNVPKNYPIKNKTLPNLNGQDRNDFRNPKNISHHKKYEHSQHSQKDFDSLDTIIDDVDIPFSLQNKTNKVHSNIELNKLPPLPYASSRNFSEALKEKCKLCETMCDFLDPEGDLSAKEIKLQQLTDILDAITVGFSKLSKGDFLNILNMIEKHIFRPLNEIDPKFMYSDGLVHFIDPSWSHLSVVYQILISLITTLPNMFDISFIKKVIHRFSAPFINEQSQLSSIVIQYIISNPDKMDQVLKTISTLFLEYLYGGIGPYAIIPALSVFHVINEQCPSLTLQIYFSHFLQLLRAPHFVYFQDIFYQILFNVFKEKSNQHFALPTIEYLIHHWPKTRSAKQVNFFNILTLAMTNLDPVEFQEIMVPVFQLVASSSCSENQKVASAAFSIWTPIEIELMIMDNSRSIFPIIYKPVSEALKDHWSTSVQDILQSILRTMDRIDPYAFHEVSRKAATQPQQSHLVPKNSFNQNNLQGYDNGNHGYYTDSNNQDYYNNDYLNIENNSNSFYHSNSINNLFSSNSSYDNSSYNNSYYDSKTNSICRPILSKKAVKKCNSHSNSILISNYSNASYNDYNQFNNHSNLRGYTSTSSSTYDDDSDVFKNSDGATKRKIGNISGSNSSVNRRILTLLPSENIDEDGEHERVRTWALIVKMASLADDSINAPKKIREIQREFSKNKKIRLSRSLNTIMKGMKK